jgi:hypothetical protein
MSKKFLQFKADFSVNAFLGSSRFVRFGQEEIMQTN